MKKNSKKGLSWAIILSFPILIIGCFALLLNSAWAGESRSIRVACIVPEIPGVNTPLIREEVKPELNNFIKEEDLEKPQAVSETNSPTMFQKDGQETRWAKEGDSDFNIKTIYAR